MKTNFNQSRGRKRIAVIGSGISGLSAAWLLSKHHDVVIFEADDRLGGHSNTVSVDTRSGPVAVDTGFIVYNETNYPNLVRLFDYLSVPTEQSDMSFAASIGGGRLEYSGSDLAGLFGQPSNIVRPRFWRMLKDIRRFYTQAPALLSSGNLSGLTLGDYLSGNGYSDGFIEDHLIPMGAAIWSTSAREMADYPVETFVRFFQSHGLLNIANRPTWRTVSGGSREYVKRIIADFSGDIRLSAPICDIRRTGEGVSLAVPGAERELFDDVVIAAHADQALSMLSDADDLERRYLGSFPYTRNRALLHRDRRLMPRRQKVWSSWNYLEPMVPTSDRALSVTYWMNRLQNLPTDEQIFVTLNPVLDPNPDLTIAEFDYAHPLFNRDAIETQNRLWELQGRGNTWFCGSYFGYGFHEDGLQSGLAVAEALGGVNRPWDAEHFTSRIQVGDVYLEAAE